MVPAPSSNSASILNVTQLQKTYGDQPAVRGISFAVHPGEIVGLLGPNGAGKTTTVSMLLGILEPTSGSVQVCGRDLRRERSKALEQTGFAAIYAPLPGNLTVYQNLRVFGLLYGVKALRERLQNLLTEFDLQKFRDTKCGVLSSGEQSRVALAKAMLNHPRLLLLDEPTASLDPATAQDIRSRIRRFVGETSGAVLWTSHNMYEVEEVCDRVLFMSRGEILLDGHPKRLAQEHGKSNLEELFIAVAREPLSLDPSAKK